MAPSQDVPQPTKRGAAQQTLPVAYGDRRRDDYRTRGQLAELKYEDIKYEYDKEL